MNIFKISIVTALILLFGFSIALGGISPNDQKILNRAQNYAEMGKVEKALDMISPLMVKYPGELRLYDAIYQIYRDVKDYENALKTLDHYKRISINGGLLYLKYADIYLKTSNPEAADSVLDLFLKTYHRGQSAYKQIAQLYLSNGYYGEATEAYLEGREKLGDSTAFAVDLGSLYQRQRQYYQSAIEYFRYVISDSMHARTGGVQLDYLIDNADEPGQVKDAFRDIISMYPDNHLAYRFYAEILIRENMLDSAFEHYKTVDSLHNNDGEYILKFSNICIQQREYQMAAEACRFLIERYDKNQYYWLAQMNLARAFVDMNQADSAVQIYHRLIEATNDAGTVQEAHYLLGTTYLEELYQTDSARHYFEKVIKSDRLQRWKDRVMVRIADSYLVDDDLQKADSIYLAVNTQRLSEQEKEKLLFNRAQIKFFQQEFSEAKGLYNLLVGVHPRSLFVNDCLRKVLIIDENQGMGMLDLELYSEGEKLLWQNKTDSALAIFNQLSERGESNLSALATFQAGEVYYEQEQYQFAFDAFRKVLESFGESFYTAESQRYLGDLYFYHFDDMEKAREAYRMILENYPNKLLYEYARRQLRKMESS